MEFNLNHVEDEWHIPEDFPRLEGQLANGHSVAFEFRQYSLASGVVRSWDPFALTVFAIRVYSDEEQPSFRSRLLHELRLGPDFEKAALAPSWEWLQGILGSRAIYDYESVEELVCDLEEELDRDSVEDAIHHYTFGEDISQPELFDQWDDSCNNDQLE